MFKAKIGVLAIAAVVAFTFIGGESESVDAHYTHPEAWGEGRVVSAKAYADDSEDAGVIYRFGSPRGLWQNPRTAYTCDSLIGWKDTASGGTPVWNYDADLYDTRQDAIDAQDADVACNQIKVANIVLHESNAPDG